MRYLFALALVAACTGDPPAPGPDAAPDVERCLGIDAGGLCTCSTPGRDYPGTQVCTNGSLSCFCPFPDATPGLDAEPDAALDAPPEVGPDSAPEAGPDVPSVDASDAAADADADAGCETQCDGACVDTGFDPLNCGACGVRCMAPAPHTRAQCLGGRCGTPCADDYDDCNGNLADGCETFLRGADRTNCGACRRACNSAERCVTGVCRPL